jgi:hypothetical protein
VVRFEQSSALAVDARRVWDRAVTPEGINDELMPIMRMTVPVRFRGKTIADVEPGTRLGRSWILLFGVLPFEYDDIGLAELGPGFRFLERSTMASMKRWQHERTITPSSSQAPSGAGCTITDRVEFETRLPIPGLERLLRAVFRRVFRHRHARIARHFR